MSDGGFTPIATNSYSPQKYREEKALGIRKSSGAKKLRKLTGKHLTCINYHLAGEKADVIAEHMGMSEAWVSIILNDPLSREKIEERFAILDMELRSLMPKAIGVLRSGMESNDENVKLSAADKWFRANGFYSPKKDESGKTSAEDLVRMLLAGTQDGEKATLSLSVEKEKRDDIAAE